MSKKAPLVVIYIESKNGQNNIGKVYYIKGEKKDKFLSMLEVSIKDLEDLKLFRSIVNKLFNQYSQKVRTWYYKEEGRAFNLSKKYRELDFNPKYRELILDTEKNSNNEIIIVEYTGKSTLFNSWFVKRTTRDLNLKDKELIRRVRADEIQVKKNDSDEIIMLNYNNTAKELFTNILLRDKEGVKRDDEEQSRFWKERLNTIHKIRRIKTHGADKYICQTYIEIIPHILLDDNFKRKSRNEEELIDYLTKHYLETLKCGEIDFHDYPNQKITVSHALDIDCDLLYMYNIHIKDLEPQAFQFIDILSSTKGNIENIQLEGPINYNYKTLNHS
jgi:hypothetical protein